MLYLDHHSETEMELGGADPALADGKFLHLFDYPEFRARL
jgi:hypothetical protein